MARRKGAFDCATALAWLAVSTRWVKLQWPKRSFFGSLPMSRACCWSWSQSRLTQSCLPEQRDSQWPALTMRSMTVGAITGTSWSVGSGTREPPETQMAGIFGGRGSMGTSLNLYCLPLYRAASVGSDQLTAP